MDENRKRKKETAERQHFDGAIEAPLRRRVAIGFIVAVLLTVFVGVSSWRGARRAENDAYWVAHTYAVMDGIERTSRNVIEAETSARAFALSGQEPLLQQYRTTQEAVHQDVDVVRRLTADNSSQQRRLDVIESQVRVALEFADSIIAKRRKQGAYPGGGDALEIERLLDGVRATALDMRAEETRLLKQRNQRAQAGRRLSRIIAGLGIFVGAGLWWLARLAVNREITISSRARLQLSHITERKRVEELREHLAAVVDSSDDAIIGKDLNGTINAWNRGAQKVFGYTASEVIGKPTLILMPPERVNEESDILARIRQGESVEHFETVRIRKDGRKIDVSVTISPIRDSEGVIVGASKIARDITERKFKEEQLRESEDRFRLFIEHAPAALAMFDHEMRYLQVSRRWRTDYGLGERELRGVSHYEIFPEIPERWKEIHRRGLAGEVQRGEDDRLDRSNGSVQWMRWEVRPWHDRTGEIAGIVIFAEEITERKRAEQGLRESEERFQAMANGIPQLAHMAGPDGAFSWYNQRWYEYTGTTREQMEGWGWRSVIDLAMLPKVMERWQASIATGEPFDMEFPLRGADGTFRTFLNRVMPLKDSEGRVVRWFGTNTDISEHKEAQELLATQAQELSVSREALEAQTRMFKLVLDSMGEGLIAADRDGRFLIWNDSAKKLMGRDASDLPTEQWTPHYQVFLSDGVTPCPPDRLPLVRALHGESVQVEMMVQQPGGAEGVFLEVSARPLKDDHGNLGGGVAVLRDITDRKAAERQVQELNQNLEARVIERTAELKAANRELEAFTYSVSHDLRAPLRHISGFTRIMVEKFGPSMPAEARQHLQLIEQGASRMGELVDELLKLARLGRQSLAMKVTGLNALVEDVVALLAPETEGRQVKWKIDELPFVECDPILMRQVFQNLISNALKYSRPRSPAVIEIGQTKKEGKNVIFVKDNGVGFEMKYADKLFGVFQRLHLAEEFEGTGIGLATVERIIQKHGGRVWVEAELDHGATFYFTLGSREHSGPKRAAAAAGGSR